MYKKVLLISGGAVLFLSTIMIVIVICLKDNKKTDFDNVIDMYDKMKNNEEQKYSQDIQLLDGIKTALTIWVADPQSDITCINNNVATLKEFIDISEKSKVLMSALEYVFDKNGKFNNCSSAFEGVTTKDVYVKIVNGTVCIKVKSKNELFNDYESPKGGGALQGLSGNWDVD